MEVRLIREEEEFRRSLPISMCISLNGLRKKMTFSVDDYVHYIYNPSAKNASTWPFNSDQYLLLNIAIEPSIASNFTSSAMEIDYIRIYQ